MDRVSMAILAVATTTAVVLAADAPRPSFDQTYGVILERNPFVRERVKPRTEDDVRRDRDSRRAPTRTVAQSFVLRGVTIEDAELHAYFEDMRSSSAVRVKPGDPLGDGRVADIAIDAVAVERAGRTVWIEVGQNLTGGQADTSPAGSTSGGSSTAGASPTTGPSMAGGSPGTAPPPLPPGASMEERLKNRRAQMKGGTK